MERYFDIDRKYVRCVCEHPDHAVIFSNDTDFGLTIDVCLNPSPSFFKRCLIALRYIFRSWIGYNEITATVIVADNDRKLIKEWLESRE